jgi:hypothetical protein
MHMKAEALSTIRRRRTATKRFDGSGLQCWKHKGPAHDDCAGKGGQQREHQAILRDLSLLTKGIHEQNDPAQRQREDERPPEDADRAVDLSCAE